MQKDHIIEVITVILLGLCSVVISLNSWQDSIYAGEQDLCYNNATNHLTEANAKYSETLQYIQYDTEIYSELKILNIDLAKAQKANNLEEIDAINQKIEIKKQNLSNIFLEAMEWAKTQPEGTDPITYPKYREVMFETTDKAKADGEADLEKGREYDQFGDAFNKSSNICSVSLFLLGLLNIFKRKKIQVAVLIISLVFFIYSVCLTFSVPITLDL